jgi:hypothetical protein
MGNRYQFTPNRYIVEGQTCKIECYYQNGKVSGYALIDVEDVERCKLYQWYINSEYPCTTIKGCRTLLRLHNFILNLQSNHEILGDHKNGNRLDCRKDNLRICSWSDNMCNVGKRKDNTSGYKGVYKSSNSSKWGAKIQKDGVNYHLGFFTTPEEAAVVYNQKARELHGEFAYQNTVLLRRKNE